MITRSRPNTLLPFDSLHGDLILCCGEDLAEFKQAVQSTFGRPRQLHAYRCYNFFNVAKTSFAWTGIGTGCLEPLLCEIFNEPNLRRIILVGTAGSISKKARLGSATPIRAARIACAGVSPKRPIQKPNWPIPAGASTQTIVSTDYYYGFTLKKDWPTPKLWATDTRLAKSVPRALAASDLVDMETGQFYHVCATLRPDLQYLAIKGAANPLTDFSQQTLHSESVLYHALREAKDLLGR